LVNEKYHIRQSQKHKLRILGGIFFFLLIFVSSAGDKRDNSEESGTESERDGKKLGKKERAT